MTTRQTTLLLAHAASTLFMTGLIWFVQIVHYPLFTLVGVDGFARYATVHSQRTAWVVVPVMLVEMSTAIWLAFAPPPGTSRNTGKLGLGLLTLIWISTIFVQVPRHEQLGSGFDAATVASLVSTNWVRTCGWSIRAGIVLVLLASLLPVERRATRPEID